MPIKLEKCVPVPRANKGKTEERTALEIMEVGDSFEFEAEKKDRVVMAASTVKMWTGKRFAVRGSRVWRIKDNPAWKPFR